MKDEDGYYIVSCPLFKGCHTYGKTIEALENIKGSYRTVLGGRELDESTKFVGYREVEIWLRIRSLLFRDFI